MRHLAHLGKGYQGWDTGRDQLLKCSTGEIVAVSDEKAEQLLSDFPNDWQDLGDGKTMDSPSEAPNVRRIRTKPNLAIRQK
ncbi:MAG: hypothetical protein KBI47_19390 [Armatimonadetes bacterium]|nr:hypothetical protein [Armatimonadota bacterium]